MKNICLVINTFSKYSDLWQMFFDSLDENLPELKRYVFVDKGEPDKSATTLHYNPSDKFRTQFLKCIENVKEKYSDSISYWKHQLVEKQWHLIPSYVEIYKNWKNAFSKVYPGPPLPVPEGSPPWAIKLSITL